MQSEKTPYAIKKTGICENCYKFVEIRNNVVYKLF